MSADAMADAVFLAVKGYVVKELERMVLPLIARLAELEQRAPVPGPRGEIGPNGEKGDPGVNGLDGVNGKDGRDGKDAEIDYDRIGNMIAVAVEKEIGKFPVPRDGRDGKDGRDGERGEKGDKGDRGDRGDPGVNGRDADDDAIVKRVFALIPTPKDGRDGKDGKDGTPGPQGERGEKGDAGERGADAAIDYDRVLRECSTIIAREVSALPKPKDGRDGRDADDDVIVTRVLAAIPKPRDGVDGQQGPQGEPGRDGRDGLPGVPGVPGDKGIDGKDGRDGSDGLGFDDLSVAVDDDGGVYLRFQRGDVLKEFHLPVPVHRGVWKQGRYKPGACRTFGGSMWIAKRETEATPGTNDDWQLAVKRGRDAS